MRRFVGIIMLFILSLAIYAQTSCYNETRNKGVSFYNKGQYQNAMKAFTAAKSCPDKPKNNDLDSWIAKCKSKRVQGQPSASTQADTYIRVDGKSSVTSIKSASGGTEVFNITTNAGSWTTWGVPSWCSIESKKTRSFILQVEPNNSTYERSDYMEVRTSNGHSARINIKQNGAETTGATAHVESVSIDHNQSLSDGKGMIIHIKCDVQNMKGKSGRVVAYFYDNEGNMLIDTNGRYGTSGTPSYVATGREIIPNYDNASYSDLKLTIPYSELHQSVTSTRTLKFKICMWDQSVNPNIEFYSGSSWTTFPFIPETETGLTVNGSSSDQTKRFSGSGGRETYFVKTSSGSYETWGVPSWCSIEEQTSSSFTLVCNSNNTSSSRSDYMKVKAAGKEIRINITQDAKSGPSARIVSVSQEHNVMNGSVKGMNIKLEFETSGMLIQKVKATAWFYYGDNTTELKNGYGSQVNVSQSFIAPYQKTTFTTTLFLPYTNLSMVGGGSVTLSFDVVINDDSGKVLAMDENNTFTFSRGK